MVSLFESDCVLMHWLIQQVLVINSRETSLSFRPYDEWLKTMNLDVIVSGLHAHKMVVNKAVQFCFVFLF